MTIRDRRPSPWSKHTSRQWDGVSQHFASNSGYLFRSVAALDGLRGSERMRSAAKKSLAW
jgi:hypothetical protein